MSEPDAKQGINKLANNPSPAKAPAPDPLAVALQSATRVVMDASLAVDVVLGDPTRQARAIRFLAICNARGAALIVPPTFPSEADTAVYRNVKRSHFTPAQTAAIFRALDVLPLDMALDAIELETVRQRARQIAQELALVPVYDSTYAALAEARGCDFWTADEKFANAAKQLRRQPNGTMAPTLPNVRWIGDF